MRVVGAGGNEVPFLGYVTVNVSFPKGEMGAEGPLKTSALVVPNNNYNQRVPVIIAPTWRSSAEMCVDEYRDGDSFRLPIFHLHGGEFINLSTHRKNLTDD